VSEPSYSLAMRRTYVQHRAQAVQPRWGWGPFSVAPDGWERYLSYAWSSEEVIAGAVPGTVSFPTVTIHSTTGKRSDTNARTLSSADPNGFPAMTNNGEYAWSLGGNALIDDWTNTLAFHDFFLQLNAPPYNTLATVRTRSTLSNPHTNETVNDALGFIMSFVPWDDVVHYDQAHNGWNKYWVYDGFLDFEALETGEFEGCKCGREGFNTTESYHLRATLSNIDGYDGAGLWGTKSYSRLYGPTQLYRRLVNGNPSNDPVECVTLNDDGCELGYTFLPPPVFESEHTYRHYLYSTTPCPS
jgi:hypothetical protein